MHFRAWVAAQRHMGIEMDPHELTDEEAGVLQAVIGWWKENRDWMMDADILRLESPDPAVIAEQQLACDHTRFVAFVGKATTSSQIAPRPLRLTRLDPEARYRINLINRDSASGLSRGTLTLKSETVDLSGTYLMNHGLTLPWSFPRPCGSLRGSGYKSRHSSCSGRRPADVNWSRYR